MLLILSRQCSPLVWLRLFILVEGSRIFTNSNLNDCNLIKITSLTPLTNMTSEIWGKPHYGSRGSDFMSNENGP
jgi:hypothetical protein